MLTHALRQLDRLCARTGFLLVGLAAWGITVAGLVLTHWQQLNPCPLCIFQRLLFMVLGSLALFAAAFVRSGKNRIAGLALALPCLLGFGVAVYQTLMQSVPGLVEECSYTNPGPIEEFVDWLGMAWMEHAPFLPELFFASGECASKEWVFMGLSLANWSLLFFSLFALFILRVSGWFGQRSAL